MNCTVPARPAVGRTLPGTVVQQHELHSRSNRLHSAREPPAWSSATQTGRTYVRKISSVTVAIKLRLLEPSADYDSCAADIFGRHCISTSSSVIPLMPTVAMWLRAERPDVKNYK